MGKKNSDKAKNASAMKQLLPLLVAAIVATVLAGGAVFYYQNQGNSALGEKEQAQY